MKKDVIRIDCKVVFPHSGVFARLAERDLVSAKIVARRKKHGGLPANKHIKRVADMEYPAPPAKVRAEGGE